MDKIYDKSNFVEVYEDDGLPPGSGVGWDHTARKQAYIREFGHVGCYSYPDCDINPLGCTLLMGADVEPFGHKDSGWRT